MPVLCRGEAEEQVAWSCPPGHFALHVSPLPTAIHTPHGSSSAWPTSRDPRGHQLPQFGSQRPSAQQGTEVPELRMASLLPLHGSCLGLCDLMPLYGKTAAVPCCVGPWSTQAPRASQAGSLPCCAPQLAMMPRLNAQVCEELPLSPLHGPSLHLLIQCAGPCPTKATHQQAASTPWALGGDGAVWEGQQLCGGADFTAQEVSSFFQGWDIEGVESRAQTASRSPMLHPPGFPGLG